MKIKSLNKKGFSHVELAIFILLIIVIASIGGYVLKHHDTAFAGSSPQAISSLTLTGLEQQVTKAATIKNLPSKLVVSLQNVSSDTASTLAHGCLVDPTATTALGNRPTSCYFGDLKAKKTMILFGDSNAWMWLPAFNQIGISDSFRVEFDARPDCEVANLPMLNGPTVSGSEGCTLFRNYVLGRVSTTHPFATVLVDYEYFNHLMYNSTPYTSATYLAALQNTVSTIKKDKSIPVMLSPPPPQLINPVSCLSVNPTNIQKCSTPAACLNGANYTLSECAFVQDNTNLSIENLIGLSGAVTKGGGTYVSLAKLFCTSSTCPPVVDNTIVFFDQAHISDHYALLVDRALSQLLPKAAL